MLMRFGSQLRGTRFLPSKLLTGCFPDPNAEIPTHSGFAWLDFSFDEAFNASSSRDEKSK
jgi:hypothetical protein